MQNSIDVNRGTLVAACAIAGLLHGGCVSLPFTSFSERIPPDPASEFQIASEPFSIRESDTGGDQMHTLPPEIVTNGPVALEDCIRIALERNPRTRSTWEAARAEAARVGEERAAYLPSVDIDAEAAHGKSVSLDSEIEREVRDTYAVGLDVSYLLLDGGAHGCKAPRPDFWQRISATTQRFRKSRWPSKNRTTSVSAQRGSSSLPTKP